MQGRPVELTPKEFELLAILAGAPGRVFGREELLDAVWGRDGFVEPRTVDVHVARLRAKFTAARLPAPGIETVRGVGYRFREPDRGETELRLPGSRRWHCSPSCRRRRPRR